MKEKALKALKDSPMDGDSETPLVDSLLSRDPSKCPDAKGGANGNKDGLGASGSSPSTGTTLGGGKKGAAAASGRLNGTTRDSDLSNEESDQGLSRTCSLSGSAAVSSANNKIGHKIKSLGDTESISS